MKLVIAIIRPEVLDSVRENLISKDVTRITINRASGHGRKGDDSIYRGEVVPHLGEMVRLEIAINDDFVKPTCEAIIESARDGNRDKGNGKIFILPIEDCIRISTGEHGSAAI